MAAMANLYTLLQNRFRAEDGQGMVEYAMIIGLVAVGVLALLALLGDQVESIFTSITNALSAFSPSP
jgi:pilus assembly protein Flp/PilA